MVCEVRVNEGAFPPDAEKVNLVSTLLDWVVSIVAKEVFPIG
jgi:hypothetical protein